MRRVALLAVLLLLAVPSVAVAEYGQQTTLLLTPSGQPVGGVWQRWMNDSYMPTYNGSMVLDLAGSCGDLKYTNACTGSSGFTPDLSPSMLAYPETVMMPMSAHDERWILLYEQAHVIDDRYLTDAQRAQFLEIWHQPQPPAGQTMANYWAPVGYTTDPNWLSRPVYDEWFADDYQLCAMDAKWTLAVAGGVIDRLPSGSDGYLGIAALPAAWEPKRGKWTPIGRVTARNRWALRTQQRSCGLIRSWLTPTPS